MSYNTMRSFLNAYLRPVSQSPRRKTVWKQVTLTDLSAAEGLLDELERGGVKDQRLAISDRAFIVQWRSTCPARRGVPKRAESTNCR